jgi:integrase/recombinase XerD
MTPLRRRMLEDMQLRGLAPKTQQASIRAVRQLASSYDKSPDLISEEELRLSFLYLYSEKHLARSTTTVSLSALKFLFEHTLRQPFPILDLLRPRQAQALPVVLSVDEVWHILAQLHLARHRVCLSTIYSCGLRVHEVAQLRVAKIDSARMQLHIQASKGNKDRYVPLPPRTLSLLRAFWRTHRNPIWLFPAADPGGATPATARGPISDRSVQRAFQAALQHSGITKPATVHMLRHSLATHLLEGGGNLRVIQVWLGHRSPTTTALYTHLTQKVEQLAAEALLALSQLVCHDHTRRDLPALWAAVSGVLWPAHVRRAARGNARD